MHILITINYPIGTAVGLVVILWLSVALRRLFFHPLSCFPGPRLAAISGLYRTYYEVIKGGKFLNEIQRLHPLYGPVIRIGPNELHFNDYHAHAEIYSVGSQFTKDPSFYSCFGVNMSAFGAIDPRVSKVRRAFMNTFFSRRAMIKLEDVVKQKADLLVSKIHQAKDTPTNMFLAFRSATVDIITVYMFGHCANALDYPDFGAPIVSNIQIAIPLLWVIKSFPWIVPLLFILPSWLGSQLNQQFQSFLCVRTFLVKCLGRVEEEAEAYPHSNRHTICHQLFDPIIKPLHVFPSTQGVFEEALSLLQAGSDTVGNTCTVGTFYILKNEAIRSRLADELRTDWPNNDDHIDLCTLQNLPYLTAVIKESLRLSHGFVSPLPRVVGPTGTKVAGYFIPPGTVVGISVTFVHLNPTLFPDPKKFSPERWLQPSSPMLSKYLVSFSSGPRMCLGISMAWAELYFFFAYMFRKLDIKVVNTGIQDLSQFRDYFVPIHDEGQLQITGTKCL